MKPIHRDRTPEEEEDHRLICRAREGDLAAFAAILRRHRKGVEGFLYRLFWDRQKAEDGAQEVFLRLWVMRHRYEPHAALATLLYRIAYNFWLDEGRKMQSRPEETEWPEEQGLPPLPAPASVEPHHQLFLRYRQRRIQVAIARLPEHYRLVFVLAHLEGHRLAEIAEILQIPVGTVKSRLHAAVRLLRGWLAPQENEVDP